GSPHAGTVAALTRILGRLAGEAALLWVQNPLRLGERSMPQPDLALLTPRADSYRRSHPTAADVLLAIEVSDTTVRFDMETKLPLYARHGIPELWIVDLNEQAIRVYREPGADGYATSVAARGEETVASVELPEVQLAAREVFQEH
ncbi:MAG: Uma2 family endonuclease, partial [Betaproteobacteria bacterium]